MLSGWRLTFLRFADGERYPALIGATGSPEWYPTLFATVRYRNASKTAQTTYSALNAIRLVHRWAERSQIDLIERFRQREFLADFETSSLATFLRRKSYGALSKEAAVSGSLPAKLNAEQARALSPMPTGPISSGFAYIRITYATEYLEWLARRVIQDAAIKEDDVSARGIKRMAVALRQLRPKGGRRTGLGTKVAQSIDDQQVFLAIASPDHAENPFSDTTTARNNLVARLLNDLGLRSGELLGLTISDFDFTLQTVTIARRHNDPNDPRARQPVAKTADRVIPISEELSKLTHEYIINHRRFIHRARYHQHLLVSVRNSRFGKAGDPLSAKSLAKVMSILSGRLPRNSMRVHPHILRHNAASNLARFLYDRGDTEAQIEDTLNAKFGWAHASGTARIYTEEVMKSLATKAQRDMQNNWKRTNDS